MYRIHALLAVMLFTALFWSCNNSEETPTPSPCDPSDPVCLFNSLSIAGAQRLNGAAPSPSTSASAPDITNNQSSARITADNLLYIPLIYQLNGGNLEGLYLQIVGANGYFNVSANSLTLQNNQVIISLDVPANILLGEFEISYCIYANGGLVSNVVSTGIEVVEPEGCGVFIDGEDGLTITTHELGDTPGQVTIDYFMYTVPDRIDVYYDGQWVAGTGPAPTGGIPPASNCNVNVQPGYVSGGGTITFNYAPTSNGPKSVDVYASGCLGGGTLWEYEISCPQ
ncbi:MAG: hypothetical protein HC913_12360 [Microscillaceae bacterium]|nr:hypothetical protein [Microscillaceae bacterium]